MNYLIQHYFHNSLNRYPEKIAISCESDEITFQDLDYFSNSLAHELKNLGVERQGFVPFFLKKSVNSLKSILGILKADCAYVPLDVESPSNRLISIIANISAMIVIVDDYSQPILESLIPEKDRPLLLNIGRLKSADTSPIDYQNLSIDIAYVLFTSGSTGTPKGVMIPHKAIIDYIDWCVETYELTENDVIANHAPLYFDNSTFDIYTAFKSGATLHLVHDDLNMVLPSLVQWIDKRKISTFFCVPSVLTLLMQSRRLKDDCFTHLRHIICAGEALPPASLQFWMKKFSHIKFTNMYGPTEITVDCSYYSIAAEPTDDTQSIPIGVARRNMELFVRSDNGNLSQAVGAKGELLVRGTSVAYGYLGDEQKTSQRFIQNPLHNDFHDLLYRTGDVVEIDKNGQFLFLGRSDDQIKYLGHRIELGEIEVALMSLATVSEAVVAFKREGDFQQAQAEIGALVTLSSGDLQDLRQDLKNKLPGYMLPTLLKEWTLDYPRTPNGKYDRKEITRLLFEAV